MSDDKPKFIGKPYMLEAVTIRIDNAKPMLDFKAFDRGPTIQPELDELFARLGRNDDIAKYRGSHGQRYEKPNLSVGYTVIPVLQQLWGLPLSDLTLSHINALRPSAIRVTGGETTCDAMTWRVTVYVDGQDTVLRIEQEVEILYGCGGDVEACLVACKRHTRPQAASHCYGNVEAIKRVDLV